MARKRIAVKKLRKILKLKYENDLSIREIATLTGISKTVVSTYIADFRRIGISYEDVYSLSDTDLTELFTGTKETKNYPFPNNASCWGSHDPGITTHHTRTQNEQPMMSLIKALWRN